MSALTRPPEHLNSTFKQDPSAYAWPSPEQGHKRTGASPNSSISFLGCVWCKCKCHRPLHAQFGVSGSSHGSDAGGCGAVERMYAPITPHRHDIHCGFSQAPAERTLRVTLTKFQLHRTTGSNFCTILKCWYTGMRSCF